MDFVSSSSALRQLAEECSAQLTNTHSQWSRLLSPLSSGSTRQDQAKDPAKRLHRFEKEYGKLLTTWRTSSNLSKDSEAAETLEIRLQELTNILSDESRRPLPHPCIQFASLRQIYVPIGKIATTSFNEWIIKEAVLFFATLIESEEESFVESAAFSASLTNLLVRITGPNSVRLGLDTESRVVELAFNITTKLRLDPEILPTWFKTQQQDGHSRNNSSLDTSSHDKFAGRTQRGDFPLFYILMDYIHHEGKVGDFARTGLLYIIEAASSSAFLEQWIVESDLSTLMATGLGALYSQLSRKLVIDHPPHNLPPILALSDYEHPHSNFEIVGSCSPEFQSHLETFLSHLLFWQDVLNHCKSIEVKSTLLEHFQVIFLQQLLYPSLLESSDIDGGSSVAVLTYLRRILESLDHPDMINLILHYLLALPDSPLLESPTKTMVSDARKRKSMDLATMMASKSDMSATPLLFNLVDLILACLRSRNQQTIYVTLQLVSAILKRHHRYAIITLLRTEILPTDPMHRTVGAHEQEVDYLMSLAMSVGGQDNFDYVYDNILKDTMTRLEGHHCSVALVAPLVGKNNHKSSSISENVAGVPREVREHTLRPDDPLLNAMLDLLETFFLNPVETNLSVTETLVDMGICGYMNIEGWMSRNPQGYTFDDDEDDVKQEDAPEPTKQEGEDSPLDAFQSSAAREAEKEASMKRCRRRPQWNQANVPRILDVLKRLCDQVAKYKESIPRFEELLQQRREAFHTADMVLNSPPPARRETPAPQGFSDLQSVSDISRSASPSRPSGLEGLAQRLFSELGTPSRSGSPKGRKEHNLSSGSGTATPSHRADNYSLATPKAIPIPPPAEFPINYSDPSKSGLPRTLSPHRLSDDMGMDLDRDDVVAGQEAAFAAVDQSILARKIGRPDEKLIPIPLKFDKPPMEEPRETAELDADKDRQADREADEDDGSGDDGPDIGPGDEVDSEVEEDEGLPAVEEDPDKVTVSHVLTNVIIFQSFILELASLFQVRAGLFHEVRYV